MSVSRVDVNSVVSTVSTISSRFLCAAPAKPFCANINQHNEQEHYKLSFSDHSSPLSPVLASTIGGARV